MVINKKQLIEYFLFEIKKEILWGTLQNFKCFLLLFFFSPDFLLKAYRINVSLQGRVWWSGAQSRPVLIEVVKII